MERVSNLKIQPVMIKVTLFAKFKNCLGDIALVDALYDIRNGKYASSVNRIRVFMDRGNPEAAERLKKDLYAITVSATYQKRRLPEYMTGYNPLILLDFDGVKKEDLPRLLALARGACYTVACWISPRGQGIKIIACPAVKLALTPDNHVAVYNLVKDWYERLLGVEADSSGSDAGRLCLFSYDPALYLSSRFEPWLKGEGEPPADLPLIEPAVDKDSMRPIATARRRTNRKLTYSEGNRNNYVHLFACHCNRLGVERETVENYAAKSFTGLSVEECRLAVGSAYAHTDQHAADKKRTGGRGSCVAQIQEFLALRYSLRRNIVRRQVEYRELDEHKAYRPVTDYWENSVWCALQKEGVLCYLSDLRAVIHSDFSPEYDPFRSYFEHLPAWDGQADPIARLASTVDTTRPEYWEKCLKKWLVAVVACALDEHKENHTVLLLSGGQGLGKTTWLRNLVPPQLRQYVYSGNIDPSAKDSSLLMSDCFLIILDELSGQSRAELNRLKALITKDAVHERRPYARNAETYSRRASFAATVNDSQVLTDRTGSRRFLCFETTRIDYSASVDHAAVFAQALALYRQGFRYWFAESDIAEVNENNEPFQQEYPEIELFYTYFRRPTRFELPLLLSCSEILTRIAGRTRFTVTTAGVNMLGKMLKRDGFLCRKKHGKRLFLVFELNHDQVEARSKGFGQDDGDTDEGIDNKDADSGCRPDSEIPF